MRPGLLNLGRGHTALRDPAFDRVCKGKHRPCGHSLAPCPALEINTGESRRFGMRPGLLNLGRGHTALRDRPSQDRRGRVDHGSGSVGPAGQSDFGPTLIGRGMVDAVCRRRRLCDGPASTADHAPHGVLPGNPFWQQGTRHEAKTLRRSDRRRLLRGPDKTRSLGGTGLPDNGHGNVVRARARHDAVGHGKIRTDVCRNRARRIGCPLRIGLRRAGPTCPVRPLRRPHEQIDTMSIFTMTLLFDLGLRVTETFDHGPKLAGFALARGGIRIPLVGFSRDSAFLKGRPVRSRQIAFSRK